MCAFTTNIFACQHARVRVMMVQWQPQLVIVYKCDDNKNSFSNQCGHLQPNFMHLITMHARVRITLTHLQGRILNEMVIINHQTFDLCFAIQEQFPLKSLKLNSQSILHSLKNWLFTHQFGLLPHQKGGEIKS